MDIRIIQRGWQEVHYDHDDTDAAVAVQSLCDDLTRKNRAFIMALAQARPTDSIPEHVELWKRFSSNMIGIPRWWGVDFSPSEYTDDRCEALVEFPPSTFQPRVEDQERAVRELLDSLKASRLNGGIVVADTGMGKTVMAIESAIRLGQRTLILVHKDYLGDQFVQTIEMLLPGEGEHVGLIKEDVCRIGRLFTIGSVQTLMNRQYTDEVYRAFGYVIADEVHRHGAMTWQYAINMFHARYRSGWTATPERKDGQTDIYIQNIGPIVSTIEGTPLEPDVTTLDFETEYPVASYITWKCGRGGGRVSRQNGEWFCNCCDDEDGPKLVVNLSKLISMIAKDEHRNLRLLGYIERAVRKGRNVLCLSDRIIQLEWFWEKLGPEVSGIFAGTKKKKALVGADTDKQVILSTFEKVGEAFNCPRLDVLVFLTPKADVHQPTGRILRPLDGKDRPFILDPVDKRIPTFERWAYARQKFYRKNGWKRPSESKKP